MENMLENTTKKRRRALISMPLRKLVQALSFIWYKDTVLRKDMATTKRDQNCHQKNSSSKISSMEKLIYLKMT